MEVLTVDPDDVFGMHSDFAETQLREWDQAEERELAGRIVKAERVLHEKHPHLTQDAQTASTAAIADALEDSRYEGYQITACPVCGFPARVDGELWLDDDVSVGRDGEMSGGTFGVFDATSLRCPTCDLVLDSPSLLKALWRDGGLPGALGGRASTGGLRAGPVVGGEGGGELSRPRRRWERRGRRQVTSVGLVSSGRTEPGADEVGEPVAQRVFRGG